MVRRALACLMSGVLGIAIIFMISAFPMGIFGFPFSNTTECSIYFSIFGLVLGIVWSIIASDFIVTNPVESHYGGAGWEKFWKTRVERKKKTRLRHVFVILFPTLAVGVAALVTLIVNFAQPTLFDFENFLETAAICIISVIGTVFPIYTIAIFCRFYSTRCRKCGCILPWEYIKTISSNINEYEKSKTVDTYGTVGELYIDNKKVGDVKGTTGTQTVTKHYTSYSRWALFRCVFCDNERKFGKHEVEYKGKTYS